LGAVAGLVWGQHISDLRMQARADNHAG